MLTHTNAHTCSESSGGILQCAFYSCLRAKPELKVDLGVCRQAGRQAGGLREALKVEGWREDGGVNEERRERREGGEEVELLNERWKRHAKGTCEARASALI